MDRRASKQYADHLLEMSVQYRIVKIMSRFLWVATLLVLLVVALSYPWARLATEGVGLAALTLWFAVGRFYIFERIKDFGHLDTFGVALIVPAGAMVCTTLFQAPDDFCRSPIVFIVALAGIMFYRHATYIGTILVVLGVYVSCRYLAVKPLNMVDFPVFLIHIPILAITFRWLVGGTNDLAFSQVDAISNSQAQTLETKSELKATLTQLETILERAPLILCVLDQNGVYVQSRGSGLSCLGFARDELVGKSYFEVFKDYPSVVDVVKAALKGTPDRVRLTMRDDLVLEVCYDALRNQTGEIVGAVGVAVNITPSVIAEQRNRALEQQLVHSQKLESLGVLAGGVAHDFNNYLMAIVAFAESLNDAGHAKTTETAGQIQEVAMQAAGVCQQMLDFAGDHQGLSPSVHVEMAEFMRNMERFLRAVVPKAISLELDFDHATDADQKWMVNVNQLKFQQVVVNVLKNACDSVEGRSNPNIYLGIDRYKPAKAGKRSQRFGKYLETQDYVEIVIQDNGCGIRESEIEKIFDLYFTTRESGHGFGMAVVARIMEDHGAFIQIETERGVGTTIHLVLPMFSETPDAAKFDVPQEEKPGVGKYNILVVDDEPNVRLGISRLLEANGHRVISTKSADEAINAVEVQGDEIDCYVLDFSMPKCTGLELLQEIRKQGFYQPAILCSGHVLKAQECNDVEYFPEAFLAKPFGFRELSLTLESLCGGRANVTTRRPDSEIKISSN